MTDAKIKGITITIAGRSYSLKVIEEEVEMIEKVAKEINKKVSDLQSKYSANDKQDCLAMALLTFAVEHARQEPSSPSILEKLDAEISVLSPLKRTDDPLSLRLGVDGIYIKKGRASGCFLPQVATETGWSKEQFLGYCCSHKAGLPEDAWKDTDTDVYLFSAEVFGSAWVEI